MATTELSTWDGWRSSHLKIVLLGGRNSGKSVLGNIILGKEEFVTKERTTCSRRVGAVAGRWVTVVDAPGWWCDFSAQDTSELVKQEIMNSISLCSPGPDVFLVAVKASSFHSGKRQRALEEHLALLGEKVWGHCIVVFTSADQAEHAREEQQVKRGGEALQRLSDKCSRRYHSVVFRSDMVGAQAAELLVKIQMLVTANGNRPFEMQDRVLQAIEEKNRAVDERAQQRFVKMKRQRSFLQGDLQHLSDIRIVLVGAKGSGKSSAANTILGREGSLGFRRTAQCVTGKDLVLGRCVTVVDTPGWWMNYFSEDSPIFDQMQIVYSPSLCPPGPHVVLLVIRVDRAFTETYRRAAQEHLELISDRIWTHVVILFTFGDWLGDTTVERYIESEGEPLRWLVEKCSNRYHVLNNKTKGDGFQVRELMGKIEEMVAGNSGWHYEIEGNVMQQLEERMRMEKERADERLLRKEKQGQMARSQLEKLNSLPEVRIVLVGGRNTGKSSCGNTILGGEWFDTESNTTYCVEKRGNIGGKAVAVLDTPGGLSVNSDLLVAPLTAFLLVVNASSSFTCAHREDMDTQLETLGAGVWDRAMVLFSHGDWLGDVNIERRIESEGGPLHRLVERCGNRYHVLDNKNPGDGAQVSELLDQIEEMLVKERLAILQRGDHMGKSITVAHKLQLRGVTRRTDDLKVLTIGGVAGSTHLHSLDGRDACGQMVALPGAAGGRAATGPTVLEQDGIMSWVASMLSAHEGLGQAVGGRLTVMVNLPGWFPTDHTHSHVRSNRKSQVYPFPPRHQAAVVVLPRAQHGMLEQESEVIDVHSLCHPTLRERTLMKLNRSGGLQALIDQWGDRNLEELEAFIDSYFEMVWEQAMGSFQTDMHDCPTCDNPEQDAVAGEPGHESLSSIDRKLSKLDLLEEIQRDLAELKQSLEHSWKAMQELRDKSRGDQD